jgi:NADH-ubiquinone oxidoreductase chain 1
MYINYIIFILENLFLILPALITVAFVTIAERKTMASMQRRIGPNIVGFYGTLQPFADALKLLIKEFISPTQSNIILFIIGPIITLNFALLGYAMIPYSSGITLIDFNLGLLYMLAVSSLATYGILLAGWAANSKYAFLGSLRSTAQLISYELILSSVLLLVVILCGSLNLSIIVEMQKSVWFIIPLYPLYIIFFIAAVAETNRAPFDLAEAESELVSGFMTEHSAAIFVFFFLAEYASIILMCILISITLLGGYEIFSIIYFLQQNLSNIVIIIIEIIKFLTNIDLNYENNLYSDVFLYYLNNIINNNIYFSVLNAIILSIKSLLFIFAFIWIRASYPRIRFDQLMSFCWTVFLPIIIGIIIFIPCILYNFDYILCNTYVL